MPIPKEYLTQHQAFLNQDLPTNAIIPTTINIGKAMYINPPTTIPIRTKGNNTMVTINFDIPHAALIPNNNNLPNTQIMQIANNNDNIFLPPLC